MSRPEIFNRAITNSVAETVSRILRLRQPDVFLAEISLVGVESSGRVAFELPRWVDREIENGIVNRRNLGLNDMLGRATWGSIKLDDSLPHRPVIVAVFGTPNNALVFVGVFQDFWTNNKAREWMYSTLEASSNLGRNSVGLPEIFMMPSTMLWDANRENLPRMLGYTFSDSLASNGSMSRIYWPLNSFEKSGIFAIDKRHGEEPPGNLHLTESPEGFLNPQAAAGGWLTR
jgi:hypothetical protein